MTPPPYIGVVKTVAALICSTALLISACSDDKKGTTPTPSTVATSVPAAPLSTTTLPTAAPSVTVAPVATADVPAVATSVVAPATTSKTKLTTTTTATTKTTVAVTSTTSASASTSAPPSSDVGSTPAAGEYATAAVPTMPAQTAKVPADNSLPDGVYYATVGESGDPPPAAGAVVFEIVQLFRGNACTAHFGSDDPDACSDDYGVETNPTTVRQIALTNQYITIADAATQDSYRVSGAELYKLIQGDTPSAGAPDGYLYSAFGYLLTVKGGKVTRLEQWWTP